MKKQALIRKRYNKAKARLQKGHTKPGDIELLLSSKQWLPSDHKLLQKD